MHRDMQDEGESTRTRRRPSLERERCTVTVRTRSKTAVVEDTQRTSRHETNVPGIFLHHRYRQTNDPALRQRSATRHETANYRYRAQI
jgi:hypothetical protein